MISQKYVQETNLFLLNIAQRFTYEDPLAEKYYSWSPYVYVMNNPMKFIDPDGRMSMLGGQLKLLQMEAEAKGEEAPTDIVTKNGEIIGRYEDGVSALYCAEELSAVSVYPNYGRVTVYIGGVTRIYNRYTGQLSAPIGEVGLINVHPEFDALFLGRGIANAVGEYFILSAVSNNSLVSLTEETFSQALFTRVEKIGVYSVYGTKGLVGNTFNRNIFSLSTHYHLKSVEGFRSLINTFEAEALKAGANKISIYGGL